jgi:hypothetical protein
MPKPKAKKPKDTPQRQHERFVKMASQVGADESPDALDKAFRKLKVGKPAIIGSS